MKRDYGLDYLRAAATYGVILWHCYSPVYYQFGPLREWAAANILFGFAVRWSVAVFVMISGALLLDKTGSPAEFYKKRLLRICIPLIPWTILYGIARLYYFEVYKYTHQPEPSFFKFVIIDQFGDLLFDRLVYHLYFVSIILGLYIIAPFLSKMLRNLSQQELGAFVAIGVGFYSLKLFLPHLIVIDDFEIGSYLVYFILGHYLYKYPLGRKMRLGIYATGIAAALLMTWLNYTTEYVHKGHQDTYYNTEGFFVFALSIAIFVLFTQLAGPDDTGRGPVKRLLRFISSCSYGIYIAHPLLISFLLFGHFQFLTFSTARTVLLVPGYKLTFIMNNAWGAFIQSVLMMVILLVFFYGIKKVRLARYFT
jgi:surface polysaccharide O-acyltransferase-like enzyme